MLWFALVSALLSPQEEIDNPEYKAWARYAPGSSIGSELVAEGTNPLRAEFTTTLKSKDEKGLVLEFRAKSVIDGEETVQAPTTRTVRPKMRKPKKVSKMQSVREPETGTEVLEIDGMKVTCKWTKSVYEFEGKKSVVKVWRSDEVPRVVRSETLTTGKDYKSDVKITLTKIDLKKG